jgi:hypothetical protein
MARGEVVVENGVWKGTRLPGRFLKRKGFTREEI